MARPIKQEMIRNKVDVSTISELNAYADTPNRLGYNGLSLTYNSESTRTVDNVFVFDASGKEGGRWIADVAFRESVKRFGVKTGLDLTSGEITANTAAMQSAINSGERLSIPGMGVVIDGTITATNIPVDIDGTERHGFIRQKSAVDTLVIANTSGYYQPILTGLRFEADGAFTVGSAIKLLGYPVQGGPGAKFVERQTGYLERLQILGADMQNDATVVTKQFKRAIHIETPSEMTIDNVFINGIGGTDKTLDTKGIYMSSARGACNTKIYNTKILGVTTAIQSYCLEGSLGIEQLEVHDCALVSVYDGIVVNNSYLAPAFMAKGNHVAAYHNNINLTFVSQSYITGNVLYNFGNENAGDPAACIYVNTIAQSTIEDNKMFVLGGTLNTASGIVSTGGDANVNTFNNYSCNYFNAGGTNKPLLNLVNGHVDCDIYDNRMENGTGPTIVSSHALSGSLNFDRNYPKDTNDSVPFTVMSWLDNANHGLGRVASIKPVRGEGAYFPNAESGNLISRIGDFGIGRTVTFFSDVPLTIQHNETIILQGAVNFVMNPGDSITIYCISPSLIKEVSRNTPSLDKRFNVSSSIANTAGTVLYNNGTQWINIPYINPVPVQVAVNTQMVKNTKYVSTNGSTPVVLTLPADGSWNAGDSIMVIGLSAGGWKIAQNAGQTIYTHVAAKPETTTGTVGYLQTGAVNDVIVIEKMYANYHNVTHYRGVNALAIN